MSESQEKAEIIDVFIKESQEDLEFIELALISLVYGGADTDRERIDQILRAIRSIKGSGGFFGFNKISTQSRVMESMMVMIRDGSLVPSEEVVETLLKGIDKLRVMVADVSDSEDVDVTRETLAIEAVLSGDNASGENAGTAAGKISSGEEKPEGSIEEIASVKWDLTELREGLQTARKRGQYIYTLKSVAGNNEELLAYKKNLESVGTLHAAKPEIFSGNGVTPGDIEEGSDLHLLFSTILEPDMVVDFLGIQEGDMKEFDPAFGEVKAPELPLPAMEENADKNVSKPAGAGEKPVGGTDTIRIRVELLDEIMELAGEIVLGRNRLLSEFADSSDTTVISTHSQRVTELQEMVMKMRLQPVGTVFRKFRRIVREMAVKAGKDINLVLEDGDVELDRSILDGLTDPITRIIENSAEHGFETPGERLFNGKPEAGTITLSASHKSGHVVITAKDDGRGIDAEKIKKSALEKALITSEEAAHMSGREAVKLIFHPGFSTETGVSDISVGSVGMDVVRSALKELGGTVELETDVGKGSAVIVRLPLTLTIMHSLIVGCEGLSFAIPSHDLVEVLRLKRGNRHRTELVQGREALRLRGELMPVARLAEILGMKKHYTEEGKKEELEDRRLRLSDRRAPEEDTEEDQPGREWSDCRRKKDEIKRVVVLRHNGRRFGLMVDAIYDSEEIVLKPLAGLVKDCESFSGSTIMGDGSVAMILNTAGIVDKSGFIIDELESKAVELEEEKVLNKKSNETLLVFKNSDKETFCLPFSDISRVERVDSDFIETVGSREFVRIREEPVSLRRLENYFDVVAPDTGGKTIYVIFPKGLKEPTGIVSTQIVDVIEREDKRVGSSNDNGGDETILIDEQVVYRLDLPDLLRAAGVVH